MQFTRPFPLRAALTCAGTAVTVALLATGCSLLPASSATDQAAVSKAIADYQLDTSGLDFSDTSAFSKGLRLAVLPDWNYHWVEGSLRRQCVSVGNPVISGDTATATVKFEVAGHLIIRERVTDPDTLYNKAVTLTGQADVSLVRTAPRTWKLESIPTLALTSGDNAPVITDIAVNATPLHPSDTFTISATVHEADGLGGTSDDILAAGMTGAAASGRYRMGLTAPAGWGFITPTLTVDADAAARTYRGGVTAIDTSTVAAGDAPVGVAVTIFPLPVEAPSAP